MTSNGLGIEIIDTHLHEWDPRTGWYPWLDAADEQLRRPYRVEQTEQARTSLGVTAAVLVQSADHDGDTDAMIATARRHPWVVGVVGHLPLDRPDEAAERLDSLRTERVLVGVRTLIHDQPDPDWLLRPDVADGLALLEAAGLPFDLVAVLPRHLEHVGHLSERFPGLSIVIDHLAKPPIGADDHQPWLSLITRAAENPRVSVKISGLYNTPERPGGAVRPADAAPWLDLALSLFGPQRLMVGSDWPISELAGGYGPVLGGIVDAVHALGEDGPIESILSGNARTIYRIPTSANR